MEIRENQHQRTWTLGLGKSKEHPKVDLGNRNILEINCQHEHSNQFHHNHDQGALLN